MGSGWVHVGGSSTSTDSDGGSSADEGGSGSGAGHAAQVCRSFSETGWCEWGDSCHFQHPRGLAGKGSRLCGRWMKWGSCDFEGCTFNHPTVCRDHPDCDGWQQRDRSRKCTFFHPHPCLKGAGG